MPGVDAWKRWSIVVAAVILAAAVNLLTGWLPRPPSLRTRTILAALSMVLAASIAVAGIQLVGTSSPPTTTTTLPQQPPPLTRPQDTPPRGWTVVVRQRFPYLDGPAATGLKDGCTESHADFQQQRLVLRLDSCRDYTFQVGYESQPRRVDDRFYLRADVQYVSGPADGYCALLFGWHDSEHWYAFKLGRDTLEVTRNKGVLPHQVLEGPRTDPVIKPGRINRLVVLSHAGQATFYINGTPVSQQEIAPSEGETRLGAQAANRSDLVRCAFDNVELWVPR